MKPKPFASLNHLTVPDVFIRESPFCAAFGDSHTCASSRLGKPLIQSPTGDEGSEFRGSVPPRPAKRGEGPRSGGEGLLRTSPHPASGHPLPVCGERGNAFHRYFLG